jgi:DNA modification methylase
MTDQQWPADRVERRAVSDLKPDPKNARTHSDAQVQQIIRSIEEWGWTNAILVDEENSVLAGHGRLQAAQKMGLDEVPVIIATGWSHEQKRAYILADNQLALNAGWDKDILRLELAELGDTDFDIGLTGFDPVDVLSILSAGTEGKTDPDDIPEAPADPATQEGDVWILGNHRLCCGDSTDADAVAKALGGAVPHLMVTDPPYGVKYDPKWRLEAGVNKAHQKRAEGKVLNDDRADWREAWELFPGDVAYVWHGALHAATVADSLVASGYQVRSQIIWAKNSLVMGRGNYHWQHEPCWYAVRNGGKAHWAGDRKQSTLWEIQNMHRTQGNVDDGKTIHGTQKPIECMRRPILNNSKAGQAVYDPFLGSGTTLIACEMEGRHCRGLELNPAYCDVIVKRWEDFTGLKAERVPAKELADV